MKVLAPPDVLVGCGADEEGSSASGTCDCAPSIARWRVEAPSPPPRPRPRERALTFVVDVGLVSRPRPRPRFREEELAAPLAHEVEWSRAQVPPAPPPVTAAAAGEEETSAPDQSYRSMQSPRGRRRRKRWPSPSMHQYKGGSVRSCQVQSMTSGGSRSENQPT